MVHPGKKDWWIAGILALVAAAMLVGGGIIIGAAIVDALWAALLPGCVLVLMGGCFRWILRATNYEITKSSLIIRTGPIRWTVPLDAIEDVVPQQNWSSGGAAIEWNFGLAVLGVRIRYRKKNGRLTWPIRIAPLDRAAFLLELSERLPGLEVKDDGLRRPADPAVTA